MPLSPTAPPPGLQGNYAGTCLSCLRATDTAIAFTGEAEFHIATIMRICDIPFEEALECFLDVHKSSNPRFVLLPGNVPAGIMTKVVRVCGRCASAAGFGKPGLFATGCQIPHYREPAGAAS